MASPASQLPALSYYANRRIVSLCERSKKFHANYAWGHAVRNTTYCGIVNFRAPNKWMKTSPLTKTSSLYEEEVQPDWNQTNQYCKFIDHWPFSNRKGNPFAACSNFRLSRWFTWLTCCDPPWWVNGSLRRETMQAYRGWLYATAGDGHSGSRSLLVFEDMRGLYGLTYGWMETLSDS